MGQEGCFPPLPHANALVLSPPPHLAGAGEPPTCGGAQEQSRGGEEQEGTNVEIWEHKNVGKLRPSQRPPAFTGEEPCASYLHTHLISSSKSSFTITYYPIIQARKQTGRKFGGLLCGQKHGPLPLQRCPHPNP